jgi:hypothetical protein
VTNPSRSTRCSIVHTWPTLRLAPSSSRGGDADRRRSDRRHGGADAERFARLGVHAPPLSCARRLGTGHETSTPSWSRWQEGAEGNAEIGTGDNRSRTPRAQPCSRSARDEPAPPETHGSGPRALSVAHEPVPLGDTRQERCVERTNHREAIVLVRQQVSSTEVPPSVPSTPPRGQDAKPPDADTVMGWLQTRTW